MNFSFNISYNNMKKVLSDTISTRKLLLIAGTGWLFDAMDVGLLSFILAALKIDWSLLPSELGLISSVNSIGMAVGAFVFGLYADKKGRKSAFIITLLLFSIASGLSAFAWGLGSLLVLRFFIGMGLGGELPVASTLVSESVAPNVRGRIVVLLESFWAVGWIFAALIAYFLIPIPFIGWRGALIICALPALYALYLRYSIPDSVKYSELTEVEKNESMYSKLATLWQKPYRKSTMMLWIVWFCVVFSYYGMFLWLPSVMMLKGFNLVQSFGYILIMTLAQLPGYFSVAWLIERVGRKWVLAIYLLGTLVSACLFGLSETANSLLLFGALLSFFNLGAWGAMYAYTPEQYISNIRATGVGLAAAIGRLGGIFGPLLVGYLVAANIDISVIFMIFAIAIFIAILAILFLGKETKQQPIV